MSVISRVGLVGIVCATLALAGCASTADDSSPSASGASGTKVDSLASMLPASIAESGVIKIAASAYAPAVIAPTGGATEPTGWDAELFTAAAGLLGLKAEYTVVPFDGVIAGLKAGRFDAAVGDIGVNADRLNTVSFVKNHYAYDVLVSKVEAKEPKSFSAETDLCGRHVGALLGSQESTYLDTAIAACSAAGMPALQVSTFQDQATVNLALAQGRIELDLTDDGAAAAMQAQSPDTFATSLVDFIPILPTGFVFANNDNTAGLTAAFAAALDNLIKSGQYAEIMEKWSVGKDGQVDSGEVYSLVVDGARKDVETTR